MPILFTKSLIVLAGLTRVSVTTGGIYYLITKENKKILNNPAWVHSNLKIETKKNKTILSLLKNKALIEESGDDNGSKWNIVWDLFKKEHLSDSPIVPWKFTNWNLSEEGTANFESFKSQCLSLAKEKVSGIDDPIFVQVERYCTTPKKTGND